MTSTAEILDRTPPSCPDAERAVIGSVILKPSILHDVAQLVRPGDFYQDANRRLFGHLLAMADENGHPGAIDVVLLAQRLKESSELELIGGVAYLEEVIQSVGAPSNAPAHVKQVKRAADLRRVIHSATDVLAQAYVGRKSAADLLLDFGADSESLLRGSRQELFGVLDCGAMMEKDFQVEFLVDHVLVRRQPAILAGPMKSLKSSVLIDLAISTATGGFFLGKYAVPQPARVLLLNGESGMATVAETIRRVAWAANIDPAGIKNLFIGDRVPRLGNPEQERALECVLIDKGIEVLCLDTLYLMLSGENQANLSGQGAELAGITSICAKLGVTLVLADHTRKAAAVNYEPLGLDSITGAGKGEWARQWLLLNRREAFAPGMGSHRLWLSVGGSHGQNGALLCRGRRPRRSRGP